jgi:hypothetical protein
MSYVSCPRCQKGQMALDAVEKDEFCLQCGYRQPHGPESRDVKEVRDPYEQLLEVVAQGLQLVQVAASRADANAAAHRKEAAKRRQQIRRITRALKLLRGERLIGQRSEGSGKPGQRPKLRALPRAQEEA